MLGVPNPGVDGAPLKKVNHYTIVYGYPNPKELLRLVVLLQGSDG